MVNKRLKIFLLPALVLMLPAMGCDRVNVDVRVTIEFGTPALDAAGLWIDITVANDTREDDSGTGEVFLERYILVTRDSEGREWHSTEAEPNLWLQPGEAHTFLVLAMTRDQYDGLPQAQAIELHFTLVGQDEEGNPWTETAKATFDL